jgi:Uma2 family endonuclease
LVQPDIFVVPVTQVRVLQWSALRDLWLVAEVLSPSTAANDRFIKRRRYQEAGVPCYWIVDGDEHYVEIWRPGDHFPTIERERLVWQPDGATEPFTFPLSELFHPV